jgi:hypothetical protein
MTRKTLAALAASFVLTAAAEVRAQDTAAGLVPPPAETKAPSTKPFFGLDAGVKGGVGGNFLSNPDPKPMVSGLAVEGVPYEDGAGGLGGGGGLYAEFRILWGHLGLELDVLFEANKNWCDIDYNFPGVSAPLKTSWITRFSTVRVPLLLEGSVENDLVRGSLGIGPEFVIDRKSSTEIEVTDAPAGFSDASLDPLRASFRARNQTDTFLCLGVGLAFKVWRLAISLDIRYAYNAGQPKDYDTRTRPDYTATTPSFSPIASSTMDLRLLLGVAYEAKFGNF